MVRYYLYILIVIFCSCWGQQIQAQTTYGDEWINFNSEYYKISVIEDGFYKVTYDQLSNAGVPVDSWTPQNIQLWYRGEQMAVEVIGENDGVFDSQDYILFYGQKNNGDLDSLLYGEEEVLNPFYNLHTDTSAYFLTWENGVGNRIEYTDLPQTGQEVQELLDFVVLDYNANPSVGAQLKFYEVFDSKWVDGEGWIGSRITYDGASNSGIPELTISVPDVSQVNENSTTLVDIDAKVIGNNYTTHSLELEVGTSSTEVYTFPSFDSINSSHVMASCDVSVIENNQLDFTYRFIDKNILDTYVPVYMTVKYPRTKDLDNLSDFDVYVPTQSGTDNRIVTFEEYNPVNKCYDITSYGEIKQYQVNNNKIVLTSGEEKRLYLSDSLSYLTPLNIKPTTFEIDAGVNDNYLIITHESLLEKSLEYETYRESTAGGSYTVRTATVNRLYDQYTYGEFNPYALRRYLEKQITFNDPKYVFLIGKGIVFSYKTGSKSYYRKSTAQYSTFNLVPTFGFPGSDLLYTMDINGNGEVPYIPIGRLSAKTNTTVEDYLNKVKEFEQVGYDELWRKNVVHLSGGDGFEATTFKSYVDSYKAIAEQPYLGADVTTFSKSTNEEIEFFNISEKVNEGVQLITFFGHSSATTSQIDIGWASRVESNYTNKGKYPMLFINGCNSGNMYSDRSQGEDWVTAAEKGAILYLGHSNYGYTNDLNSYTKYFYETAFTDDEFYGKPIGDIHKQVIDTFYKTKFTPSAYTQRQQFNLQGDPALVLYDPSQPDYFIDETSLSLLPVGDEPITAVSDSFYVQVNVSNFGKSLDSNLSICIDRVYNNGQNQVRYGPFIMDPVYRENTFLFTISSQDVSTFGENTFTITVDCNDSIAELNELNNTASIQYFMQLSGVRNLYPHDFAVVGNDTITFVSQSTSLLTDENTSYLFELDTTDDFSNPLMTLQQTTGAVALWEDIKLPFVEDSLTYYWRVRFVDITPGEDTLYAQSSFTYITDKEGWGQNHFAQFKKNSISQLSADYAKEVWDFDSTKVSIYARTGGHGIHHNQSTISVNDQVVMLQAGINSCQKDGLFVLAFDKNTGLPFHPNGLGGGNCGNNPRILGSYVNTFATSVQTNIMSHLNQLEQGDYVLIMSVGQAYYESWTQEFLDTLAKFGTQKVDTATNKNAWVFVGRKGGTSPIYEFLATDESILHETTQEIFGQYLTGTITTPLIGPASSWEKYSHRFDVNNDDELQVEVFGVDLDENRTSLITLQGSEIDDLDISTLAGGYTYLQMEVTKTDSLELTAPDLRNWYILYEDVPEGIMNASAVGIEQFNDIEKSEGDSVHLKFAFQNISDHAFDDSLIVEYQITNEKTGTVTSFYDTLSALSVGDTLLFNQSFSTNGFVGNNLVYVNVNPKIQPEKYYNNNALVFEIDVREDNIHPLLDVLFDGRHILNGELVSASPEIHISMKDENIYQFKSDTVGIEVFLQAPCTEPNPLEGCPFEQISLSASNVSWTPATESTPFSVDYNPQELADGTYTLLVQVEDVAGNTSGVNPYEIQFNVTNEASITQILPYPNPFSTSTRFVFTLTGREIPDEMYIQIMTITGRVVREIGIEEIGDIHIGDNITSFAWDGTDQYGDRLANGTYIYKAVMKKDGKEIKHAATKADAGFKKGYGKIVIIR